MTDGAVAWPAPAKLNLFLRVTGRRPDGYHELQTVFQMLDWGDALRFEARGDRDINRSRDLPGVSEDEDLCLRAARLLQRYSGGKKGATITLEKHIPKGSGLGGGSSDAATVLHALNRLWGCGLSTGELAQLGLALGADVPVFVHGYSAWAEGIGDRLQPMDLEEAWYVLVFPELEIATSEVFAHPDLLRDSAPLDPSNFDPESGGNTLEGTVLDMYPEMRRVFTDLEPWGRPRLTGTGSCVFMRFNEKIQAERTTNGLKSLYNVRAARGVNRSPLLKMLSGDHWRQS
jgi:4-diphosphocytidyl-2-C-methyl-D-erythritol kinase